MTDAVVVTGASGLLGRQVYKVFADAGWNVVGTGLSRCPTPLLRLNITNRGDVEQFMNTHRPRLIVHCAANRFPDRCDKDPAGARKINVEATQYLVDAAIQHSALLIYISTDYVFPGTPGEAPYEASATCAPSNVYGQTKLAGERIVTDAGNVVLRVPVLYGEADSPADSAVNTLVDAVWKANSSSQPVVTQDHWAKRSPTNTEDVARVVRDISRRYLEASTTDRNKMPAILHFTSPDVYTKYEICEIFADILGLPMGRLEAVGAPAEGVQRPYDTHLSTRALQELGIPLHTQDFVAWWRWNLQAIRK